MLCEAVRVPFFTLENAFFVRASKKLPLMRIMKNLLTLLFVLGSFFYASAQTKTDTGKIVVSEDPRVQEMLKKYGESRSGKIKGYRVQIHFGAEKSKAKDAKSRFMSKYPDIKTYDMFETPYFKVRVGDFRTKLEAYKFLKELEDTFPGAFIVEDNIELPEL
jgi:hypothetical protein